MKQLERLFAANHAYASEFSSPELPSIPSRGVAILTCMDTRIDPLAMFQAELGELHVIRNAGGRVTDDAIRSLVVSEQMLGTTDILVIQHTDCGMMSVDNDEIQNRIADNLGPEAGKLALQEEFLTFSDLDDTLKRDVHTLRTCPLISKGANICGAIYDVKTGRVVPVLCDTCENP